MSLPTAVKIVEVGPRDGLQNEDVFIPMATKIEWINQLSNTGLSVIETTSFVSPKWIPQLADHREVFSGITQKETVTYPVLVLNPLGLEHALQAGVKDIAVFATSSEQFCRRNANCSVAENNQRLADMIAIALAHKMHVRAYISCMLGCPYEGEISPLCVANLAAFLIKQGCFEVSLGDTIGVGTPKKTQLLLDHVMQQVPCEQLAVHFHDTYGQALVNIYVALQQGISIIDSSVSGLGGCPYAQGASGNVATEDVVYMLHGLGIYTGVALPALIEAGHFIMRHLGRQTRSKVSLALS